MAGLYKKWQELEALCSGCRNECDQKCVIDNHEVEILQAPAFELPNCGESWCPSNRTAMELCSARKAVNCLREGQVTRTNSNSFRGRAGFDSDRSCISSTRNIRSS
eukprot:TRINITY_DN68324_c0_g1_i1.p2 TRINITY_DN68324_c0_g1~~TRINITY_DN68324_c0_g1_i1.p2  ORF type:complete len:106 (+),score=11.88 TRINITY_DN68324_c0_g1_i1:69-386(+)